ncbi:hypothetical protein O1611_g5023 [Lasiodiplodia mahajangana]|uniref:Uncharacterized protein n=1 Tax=Lasiodiplodia mahajangana TaxID=1108764 RepID=A0ACC2JMC3_9PEZI|nr:hypothetical protein O1611_g5023 [Lasiodiplodia mahajangana]
MTPLILAVLSDDLERARRLIDEDGADVNEQVNGDFSTALQAAACCSSLEVVELLIEKGADVNQQGGFYGNALQTAVVAEDLKVAKFLVDNGANVNQQGGFYDNAI